MKKGKVEEYFMTVIDQRCSVCGEKIFRCDRCQTEFNKFEENEKIFCPENKYQMHYCEKCNKVMKGKPTINWSKRLPMAWRFKEYYCEIRNQLMGKKM